MGKFGDLSETAAMLSHITSVGNAFAKFDVNGDGNVTKEELARVLRKLDPELFTDERVNGLFAAMDRNNDHHISYTEFVDFIFAAGTNTRSSNVDKATRDAAHSAIEDIANAELGDEGFENWRRDRGSATAARR